MVRARFSAAALAAAALAGAAAAAAVTRRGSFDFYYPPGSAARQSYDYVEDVAAEKVCYPDGERAVGAPGKPSVPWMSCCSGKMPLPMDAGDAAYKADRDWGLFCGGTGKIVVDKDDCYGKGVRGVGAPGKPYVPYKPCCDGREPQEVYGDWGRLCGMDKPDAPKPTVAKEYVPVRCSGEEGYPYVDYVQCAKGEVCQRAPAYGWGLFCVKGEPECGKPGEKCQGAPGYPLITYRKCCDGAKFVTKSSDWGYFCPVGKKQDVYVATPAPRPVYYAPVNAPKDYVPPKSAPVLTYAPPTYYGGGGKNDGKNDGKPVSPDSPMETITNNFGCATAGAPAVTTSDFTFEGQIVEIVIPLPDCGTGYLTDAQALGVLTYICGLATTVDNGAECRISQVPPTTVVRTGSGSALAVADRQFAVVASTLTIQITFQFTTLLSAIVAFIALVAGFFGQFASVTLIATESPAA